MAALTPAAFVGVRVAAPRSRCSRARRGAVCVRASAPQGAAFVKVLTVQDLKDKGGRAVVEVNGQQVLIQELEGVTYAVSNKCSHLNLSMQGKTALLSAAITPDKCIVCPAHKTAFDLATGEVKGEWCPGFPDLPFVGKMKPPAPLPVYPVKIEGNLISVAVASRA